MARDCIFCQIVKGKIDCAKIWEDDDFLAILDIKPNTKGVTLVLTKKHYSSDIFTMPKEVYQKLMLAVKRVVKILKDGLGVKRVGMVLEGTEINHAHIKLYPLHGFGAKFKPIIVKGNYFFKKYQGYLTTLEGPEVSVLELKKLAKEIKKEW